MDDDTDPETTPDRSAQVGVSTLVVFIAAVLVAAATAGVLVHTVDVLESRSDATGSRVADQVTDDVSVVAVTGTVNQTSSPPTVDAVRIIVSGTKSTDAVDLGAAQIEVRSPAGQSVLTASTTGPTRRETFTIEPLADPDGSAPVITETDDRFALDIATTAMEPGDRFTATILLETGATRTVRISIPRTIRGRSAVVLR